MIFRYDASQEKCPLPLVNLRLMLKKMQKNDTCVIKIADKGSIEDIPKLLTKLGYEFKLMSLEKAMTQITITTKQHEGS